MSDPMSFMDVPGWTVLAQSALEVHWNHELVWMGLLMILNLSYDVKLITNAILVYILWMYSIPNVSQFCTWSFEFVAKYSILFLCCTTILCDLFHTTSVIFTWCAAIGLVTCTPCTSKPLSESNTSCKWVFSLQTFRRQLFLNPPWCMHVLLLNLICLLR